METRLPPMDEVAPAQRVLYKTRAAFDYYERVVNSTVAEHGAAVEAAISRVMKLRARHNTAYVRYLKNGGTPGNQARSDACDKAETALFAGWDILAAILAVLYPAVPGISPHPIFETRALIDKRTGPLCNGWATDNDDTITHHPQENCPVHGAAQPPHRKGPLE